MNKNIEKDPQNDAKTEGQEINKSTESSNNDSSDVDYTSDCIRMQADNDVYFADSFDEFDSVDIEDDRLEEEYALHQEEQRKLAQQDSSAPKLNGRVVEIEAALAIIAPEITALVRDDALVVEMRAEEDPARRWKLQERAFVECLRNAYDYTVRRLQHYSQLNKDRELPAFITAHSSMYKGLTGAQVALVANEIFDIGPLDPELENEGVDDSALVMYDGNPESPTFGVYVDISSQTSLLAREIRNYRGSITDSFYDALLDTVRVICPARHQCGAESITAARNGIYDLSTDTLRPFSPEYVFTDKLAVDVLDALPAEPPTRTNKDGSVWNPRDFMLDTMGDVDKVRSILELIIFVVFNRKRFNKFVFLYAESGSNGKGTMLEMLRNIVGAKRCAALSFGDISDKFKPYSLRGKHANLSDESEFHEFVQFAGNLKALTTHDRLELEGKHLQSVTVRLFIPMIFSINNAPVLKDKSDSLLRRIHIVKFDNRFLGAKENKQIRDEYLQDEEILAYMLRWAIEECGDIDSFTVFDSIAEANEEYAVLNDPVRAFYRKLMDAAAIHEPDIIDMDSVYDAYVSFMENESPAAVRNSRILGKSQFSKKFYALLEDNDLYVLNLGNDGKPLRERLIARIESGDLDIRSYSEMFDEFGYVQVGDSAPNDGGWRLLNVQAKPSLAGMLYAAKWQELALEKPDSIRPLEVGARHWGRAVELPSREKKIAVLHLNSSPTGQFIANSNNSQESSEDDS